MGRSWACLCGLLLITGRKQVAVIGTFRVELDTLCMVLFLFIPQFINLVSTYPVLFNRSFVIVPKTVEEYVK